MTTGILNDADDTETPLPSTVACASTPQSRRLMHRLLGRRGDRLCPCQAAAAVVAVGVEQLDVAEGPCFASAANVYARNFSDSGAMSDAGVNVLLLLAKAFEDKGRKHEADALTRAVRAICDDDRHPD